MESAGLLAYAAAFLLSVLSPGPAMVAVISTGMTHGARPAVATAAGVTFGDLILVSLAMLGLVALVETASWLFTIVRYGGAAYLIWLGMRMWRTPVDFKGRELRRRRGHRPFRTGLAIALGNPKAILFHASLMPLILDLRRMTPPNAIPVLLIVLTVNLVVMSGYGIVAGGARSLLATPARVRWLSRIGGGAMIGTGAVIATR